MRDNKHRHVVLFNELRNASFAFLLKHEVTHGKHFVNNEYLGYNNRGDGKGNASYHAGRIVLHGHIQELLDLGEFDDFVKMLTDKLTGIPKKSAVEVNVFARRQFHIKPST